MKHLTKLLITYLVSFELSLHYNYSESYSEWYWNFLIQYYKLFNNSISTLFFYKNNRYINHLAV